MDTREWLIESELGQELRIVQEISKYINPFEPRMDDILISVAEACINAIEHGNQLDKTKFVKLTLNVSPSEYLIRVYDEGSGTDIFPERPEIQEKFGEDNTRGWGLYLISTFTDKVVYGFDDIGRFFTEMRFYRRDS